MRSHWCWEGQSQYTYILPLALSSLMFLTHQTELVTTKPRGHTVQSWCWDWPASIVPSQWHGDSQHLRSGILCHKMQHLWGHLKSFHLSTRCFYFGISPFLSNSRTHSVPGLEETLRAFHSTHEAGKRESGKAAILTHAEVGVLQRHLASSKVKVSHKFTHLGLTWDM